jgi:hypothetical protein
MYNAEQVVVEFHRQLMDVVTPLRREYDVRICYVNDGSVDHTGAAALMIAVGLVGIYVGYIFQEVRRRPVYLLRGVDRTAGDRPPRTGGGQEP